jgi:hypothetical protein
MEVEVVFADACHVGLGSLFDARSMPVTFLAQAASRRASALLDGTGTVARQSRHPCPYTKYKIVKDTCSLRRNRVASGGLSVVINLLLPPPSVVGYRDECNVSPLKLLVATPLEMLIRGSLAIF